MFIMYYTYYEKILTFLFLAEEFPTTDEEFRLQLRNFLINSRKGRMFLKDIKVSESLVDDDFNISVRSLLHL